MKLNLQVHGVSSTTVPVKVEYEGHTVNAPIECFEVELTSPKRHGSTTLRFIGKEIEEAMEVFKRDGAVSVTFEAVETEKTEKAAA